MIARLRGRVAGRAGDGIVVDVGGVGYLVHATPSVLRSGGDGEVVVETYTVVREDALQLYGFATTDERDLFEALLSVSGVGPKVALAIVSGSQVAELRKAIVREDTARFQAIPGIGKKTAERVVLELKEKFSASPADAFDATGGEVGPDAVATEALVALGWTRFDAERVLADIDPELPAEDRVRAALRRAA